jgi:hypothetical protein
MSTTFELEYHPTPTQIREVFAEEVAALGGDINGVYQDEHRLYARAVLPQAADVRPGDQLNAGIAVRVAGPEILVHPYTFRQVCTNGAIAAHALQSRRLERVMATEVFAPAYEVAATLNGFRLAMRSCAAPEVFATITAEMRSAAEQEADLMISLVPALSGMPQHIVTNLMVQISRQFGTDNDRTGFGMLNAVTAVARRLEDPETRWRLEALGGTLPARLARAEVPLPVSVALSA